MDGIPPVQRIIAILWPSFITAGIATVLFTVAFDPVIVFPDKDLGRIGLYGICFFLFWLFGAFTAAATCYSLKPCSTINNSTINSSATNKVGVKKTRA